MKEAEFVYENEKRKIRYSTQKRGSEIIFSIKIIDINLSKFLPGYFTITCNGISGKLKWENVDKENVFTQHKIKYAIIDQIYNT